MSAQHGSIILVAMAESVENGLSIPRKRSGDPVEDEASAKKRKTHDDVAQLLRKTSPLYRSFLLLSPCKV